MSAEKLPPDGYELGPGWLTTGTGECLKAGHRDPDRRGRASYIRDDGFAVCPEHAEEAGAIVRKAEAPRCEPWCGTERDEPGTRNYCTNECGRAERPLHPAEPPAAPVGGPPVGSLAEEVLRIVHAFNSGDSRRDDVRALSTRIAALEAEVAARLVERDGWMEAAAKSEREKDAIKAELADAKQWTLVVAETAYGATQSAVLAERERCAAEALAPAACYRCNGERSIVTGRGVVACGTCRGIGTIDASPKQIAERIRNPPIGIKNGEPAP